MENKKTWVVTAKKANGEEYREEVEATEEEVKGAIVVATIATNLTDIKYEELTQEKEEEQPKVSVDPIKELMGVVGNTLSSKASNPLDELLEVLTEVLSETPEDMSSKKQSVDLSTELEGLEIGESLISISLKRTADSMLVGGIEAHDAFNDLTLEDQRNLITPFMASLIEELADKLEVSPEDFLK